MLLSMLISSAPGCSSACWLCWPNRLHHLAGSSTCQQHDGHHTLPNWLGVCRWRPYCCWRTAAVPTGSNNSTGRGNQLGGVQWYVCTETLFHMCVHLLIVPCCRVHVSACVASILAPDLGTTGIQLTCVGMCVVFCSGDAWLGASVTKRRHHQRVSERTSCHHQRYAMPCR
jgi:hypothetical protein